MVKAELPRLLAFPQPLTPLVVVVVDPAVLFFFSRTLP
jgi:hypothetical protein